MHVFQNSRPAAKVEQPFLVLLMSILCQIGAGTLFWYPAITPGIQIALGFSTSQIALVVLLAASGPYACVFGGIIQHVFGNRIGASFSAFGLSVVFLVLSLLTATPYALPATVLLPLVLFLTYLIVVFSFLLYASSISACAPMFPSAYRGRVVGLCACSYGGSGAAFSTVQAAFLPHQFQTPHMLFVAAMFSFATGLGVALFFPKHASYDTKSLFISEEHTPLTSNSENPCDRHVTQRLRRAYQLLLVCFLGLQLAAFTDVLHLSRSLAIVAAIIVVTSLALLGTIPLNSRLRILPECNGTSTTTLHGVEAPSSEGRAEPSFLQVLKDPRYIFILYAGVFYVGGGGIALLVQLQYVIEAITGGDVVVGGLWNGARPGVVTRMLVLVFSAGNMGARLLIGAVGDRGNTAIERHLWKYKLLMGSTVLMTLAMVSMAFASQLSITLGMIVAGMSFGTYFVVEPTFLTSWFGTGLFLRNVCIENLIESVGAVLVGNWLPHWGRETFGSWKATSLQGGISESMCLGRSCVTPTFSIMAGLTSTVVIFSLLLRQRVKREAGIWLY